MEALFHGLLPLPLTGKVQENNTETLDPTELSSLVWVFFRHKAFIVLWSFACYGFSSMIVVRQI